MIVPRHYEDLSVLHENTQPVHAYFIPVSPGFAPASDRPVREDSDRLTMLSGAGWRFRYYSSIHALTAPFYEEDFAADEDWAEEQVPFCWQMRGYDENQYTNIRYPIPFDPPYVPQHNPCGAYRKSFTWHKNPEAPRTYLHFEGVDSCFYAWLNGRYLGYSQVTHHTSEFDVTAFLREGDNLLAVLVLKWCDGSYLEDQDKFRLSGIIRDVYLIDRPERHIADYVVTTALAEDFSLGEVCVHFTLSGGEMPVKASLAGETAEAAGNEIRFRVDAPRLWTAETPELYDLCLETENERIYDRVGFRTVRVQDGVLLLNGRPIKFRGVNRHESDPFTGSVVMWQGVWQDLTMIKAHNFNAVRASHYPDVPYFYQLCDAIGLYVIDEADNESHGTAPLYFNEDDYFRRMQLAHERIADNPAFIAPTLDRVASMVLRNRNRPCILVWSMGNECGYGCTFEEALRWTKETDPTRLTHYESAYYAAEDREYDVSGIDLFGRMYPAFEEITDYMAGCPEKPLLLVEYCHAMGNGPGDIQEYRDLTEKYPRLCGGFVWEWCDHAVVKGLSPEGKPMYWYGGDHGEIQHDGNFCLDGLVYPDRTPHTGLLEYKNVHRPLRSTYDSERRVLVTENFLDFLDLGGKVWLRWSLTADGDPVMEGKMELPSIAPHTKVEIPLPLAVPAAGRCFLCVTYVLKEAVAGLPAGHVLGFDDIPVATADGRNQKAAALAAGDECKGSGVAAAAIAGGKDCRAATAAAAGEKDCMAAASAAEAGGCEDRSKPLRAKTPGSVLVLEDGTDLVLTGPGFIYRLDTLSGLFTSWQVHGHEFLRSPLDFNLWRAPTDNDAAPASLWRWERLDKTVTRAYEVSFEEESGAVAIKIRQSVAAMSVQPLIRFGTVYTVHPDGAIHASFEAEKDPHLLMMPRLGLRAFLDPALDQAVYYGVGPCESYIDKHRAGRHGCFTASVRDLHEDYIRPQENGSHWDCDYVQLTGGGLTLTAATGDGQSFSFNASVYTQEEMESRRHNYELEPCGSTVLCLDHRMAGIGSKSCGPDLSKAYRVDADRYHFAFVIRLKADE